LPGPKLFSSQIKLRTVRSFQKTRVIKNIWQSWKRREANGPVKTGEAVNHSNSSTQTSMHPARDARGEPHYEAMPRDCCSKSVDHNCFFDQAFLSSVTSCHSPPSK
jgi:hypothetical protein